MPQPVLTKYKQGDLGADYSKDTPVGEKIDMSIHANDEIIKALFFSEGKKIIVSLISGYMPL